MQTFTTWFISAIFSVLLLQAQPGRQCLSLFQSESESQSQERKEAEQILRTLGRLRSMNTLIHILITAMGLRLNFTLQPTKESGS